MDAFGDFSGAVPAWTPLPTDGPTTSWDLPPKGYGTAAGHALIERSFNHSLIRLRNHPSHVAFSFGNGEHCPG